MGRLQFVLDITYNLTVEKVDGALGAGGILLGVSHHYDGGAFGVQLFQQVHDLFTVLGIQITGRLIREDQLRAGHHGTGDGHALLLTAGKLLREVIGTMADGHTLHNLRDLGLALAGADIQIAQRQLNVLIHIEFVDQVEALEHKADVALAELGALLLLQAADFGAEEFIGTAGGIVQQAEDVQQRGLAAAGRAHDGDELAVLDFEGNAVEGRGLDLFRPEDLGKIGDLYHFV